MSTQKIILLIINAIGGVAVIGSYIAGLSGKTNQANALWGGTPASVRPIYTFSMLLAALGYFAFIYFIMIKIDVSQIKPGFWIFYIIFLGILALSALWMPLTNVFVSNPSPAIWMAIRIVLAAVGLFSCALAFVLISLHSKEAGLPYWLAIAGSVYFAFHTLVLDGILWPIFFRMH